MVELDDGLLAGAVDEVLRVLRVGDGASSGGTREWGETTCLEDP
ncbi:MAG: hypothetical protein ACTMHL_11690 [Janibacter sp.]